jgi:hypothetical protein
VIRLSLMIGGAAALLVTRAGAQGDCFPSDESNEARAMAIFSVPLAFSAAASPAATPSGRLRLGLETAYLPNVDRATATPTVCRPGKGPENTDFLPAMVRPRATLGLPSGFSLEGSWTPPLRVHDVKAHLFGMALGKTIGLDTPGATLGRRAHASLGTIKAPITCNDDALTDPVSECFQGTRSDDAFKPNVFGLEAAVGWPVGKLRPYLGGGYSHLAPRFRVNFTNSAGSVDRRKVTVDLERAVLFAGATWTLGETLDVSGEIYSAPTDAVTGRVQGRIRLR